MSLTQYLKQKLGITFTEASLVEKEVKRFTSILKESKVIKSNKKRLKEQDEEMPAEEPDTDMDMDMGDSDMDNGLIGGKYPDNEVEMIKVQLKSIVSNAESLMNTLDSEQNLDAWIQSKITLAQDYLNSAHDYIVYSDTYNSDDMDSDISMDDTEEPMEEIPVEETAEETMLEEPVSEEPAPAETPEALPAPEETPEVKESFKYGFISF